MTKFFGVPACPYCRKRVNLIRRWSLKKEGEYRCPRCGGISNIYLSPLIYVAALLAVFAGGSVYFFHRYVLDDVTISTVVQVLIPFAVFFVLALFLVYLEKPVIKKIPKAEMEKKRWKSVDRQNASGSAESRGGRKMFTDEDEYQPRREYRTGTLPKQSSAEMDKTSVVEVPDLSAGSSRREQASPAVEPPTRIRTERPRPASSVRQELRRPASVSSQSVRAETGSRPAAVRPVRNTQEPVRKRVEISAVAPKKAASEHWEIVTPNKKPADDYLAKYDDEEYVDQLLKKLEQDKGE